MRRRSTNTTNLSYRMYLYICKAAVKKSIKISELLLLINYNVQDTNTLKLRATNSRGFSYVDLSFPLRCGHHLIYLSTNVSHVSRLTGADKKETSETTPGKEETHAFTIPSKATRRSRKEMISRRGSKYIDKL